MEKIRYRDQDIIEQILSKWTPHQGQIKIGQALFRDGYKSIFVQCGRKFGKTELITYILWAWAYLYPGASCYYIAPFMKQAKEILWANRRMQTFGPREWIKDVNNSELRVNFANDSFIKLDGSDNFDAYRGIEPHILVMEEYKDHRPEFMESMRPNLAVYDAPIIFIGTPPESSDNIFLTDAEEHKHDPNKFFYKATSLENPHIDRAWLDEEKARLYARGEGDVWEREYMAEFVRGGANKIFPMLKEEMVKPHDELVESIQRDKRKLEWFLCADPAAASIFAVLFGAYNPYTKEWFILDEIYESSQAEMTVERIGMKILSKRNELFAYRWKEWRQIYDEAETWFMNEMLDRFSEAFEPTHKMKTDKTTGISLTKDIMFHKKIHISSRCTKFFWELDNYQKDKNGKIPKKHDHLIDCFRYMLHAAAYDYIEQKEFIEERDSDKRMFKLEDDFPGFDGTGERKDEWMDFE